MSRRSGGIDQFLRNLIRSGVMGILVLVAIVITLLPFLLAYWGITYLMRRGRPQTTAPSRSGNEGTQSLYTRPTAPRAPAAPAGPARELRNDRDDAAALNAATYAKR